MDTTDLDCPEPSNGDVVKVDDMSCRRDWRAIYSMGYVIGREPNVSMTPGEARLLTNMRIADRISRIKQQADDRHDAVFNRD